MERVPFELGLGTAHLRTLISGKTSQILLVHGLGLSGNYFVEYAQKLAQYYDVHIIDLPGYGRTPKPPKPLTIVELSNIITKYVSSSNINDCIVIGQSMGCQVIVHAIVHSPHLFSRAILLAPATNKKERRLAIQLFRLFQDSFHEKLRVNLMVFNDYIRMGFVRFLITAQYMIKDHIEDALQHVTIPVLIVCGSKDKIAPMEWGEFLADTAQYGTALELQGAPHLLHCQKPDELVDITRMFTNV